jgi:O-antigen/teichoic acid export membrane protein
VTSPPGDGDRAEPALSSRIAVAAGWMIAFRWIDRLIGLASIALLARLLAPVDFGIVGYAVLIIGFLELFSGLATDQELIRHQQTDRARFDAAWTMNLLKGIVLCVGMILLAPLAADFFSEPRAQAVMYVLAAQPLLHALENVGTAEFQRDLAFDREFRFLLVPRLAGTLATVVLAFALRDYWALVAGTLLREAVRVAASYRMHPFRPRLAFAQIPAIFRFSRWMVLQNLASGLCEHVPRLVVGRAFEASWLALYNVSKEVAYLAKTEVAAPIRRVLYPVVSQMSGRADRIGDVLVGATGMFSLLTLPVSLGIALVAADFVPLFLGSKWVSAVGILQPLCIAAAIQALDTNGHIAYMATNRAHLAAAAGFVRLLLMVALMAAFVPHLGAAGVAYAIAASSGLLLLGDYVVTPRVLGVRTRSFLAVVWRPLVAVLVMVGIVVLVRGQLPSPQSASGHLLSLAASAAAGAIVYIATVFGLWRVAGSPDGAERRVLAALARAPGRKRAA